MNRLPIVLTGPMLAVCLACALVTGRVFAAEGHLPQSSLLAHADKDAHAATEARDPNRLWCNEHDVYEDECVLCHPELANKAKELKAAEGKAPGAELQCKEHHLPERECGICHPERVGTLAVGEAIKVRFASAESTIKAGVSTASPVAAAAAPRELLGEVGFNQNRFAMVSSIGGGVVTAVAKETGEVVEAGEVLASIQSAELAEARSAYDKAVAGAELARQALKRETDLHQRQISARQDLERAQAETAVAQSAVTEARQRLQALGLSEQEVSTGKSAASKAVLSVRAPFAGTVLERKVVRGAAVAPGDALFQIADLSSMWMAVSVPENLLAAVQTGGTIAARFDAYPGLAFEGEIRWISPSLDPVTRMLQVRAELPNPQGLLKSGLFGRATIQGRNEGASVSVPATAVQDIDGVSLVFRKLEDDLYEARRVEVGARDGVRVTLLAGLAADEEIVVAGSYIVKSELLKARLGAGCTDE